MTGDAIEFIRQWISTASLVTITGFAARLYVQNRKLRMQEKVEDRQGFGVLIEALSKEVSALRKENGMLRYEVRELHGLIDGMSRGDLQVRTSAQVLEMRSIPPATAAALDRIERKIDETQ